LLPAAISQTSLRDPPNWSSHYALHSVCPFCPIRIFVAHL